MGAVAPVQSLKITRYFASRQTADAHGAGQSAEDSKNSRLICRFLEDLNHGLTIRYGCE